MKRIGTRTGEKRGGQTNNTHEDEEEALVVFDEGDVADGIAGCENSLIKKVISEKTIHKQAIQTAMANIWNNPYGFRVEDLGNRLFQFYFDDEVARCTALRRKPWIYHNA